MKPVKISTAAGNRQERPVKSDGATWEPTRPANYTVHSKSTLESIIGATRYDKQTNNSMQPRLFQYGNGTIAASWMQANNEASSWSDRGTGYNYFNGTSWGAVPMNRIESARNGWPAYGPLGPAGEMVISHRNATSPLTINTRPTIGSGAWTESTFAAPSGATGLEFPRFVTNGPDHNQIHLLALTGPTQFSGQPYMGLDGAVVYSRSLDGGVTWDIQNEILDGMTSLESTGIGPDDVAWAEPKGDTLVFVVGGHWNDTYMMKSVDNGTTWTKTIIVENAFRLNIEENPTPRFACSDGSMAAAIDSEGRVHVAFGRMFARDNGPAPATTPGRVYFPVTDGLVYWNSDMEAIDTAILASIDSLYAHGQLLGYVPSNTAGDTIVEVPRYGMGLTSIPQMAIDEDDNIFVVWAGLVVDNPLDGYNYRHLFTCGSNDHGQTFSDQLDLNSGIGFIYQEFVFPAVAWQTTPDKIHCLFQTADQPGSAVTDDRLSIHDNALAYRTIDKDEIIPYLGVNPVSKSSVMVSKNYPNPFRDRTSFEVTLDRTSTVVLEIYNMVGQQVRFTDLGTATAGKHTYSISGAGFEQGVYISKVIVNNVPYVNLITVD